MIQLLAEITSDKRQVPAHSKIHIYIFVLYNILQCISQLTDTATIAHKSQAAIVSITLKDRWNRW